MIGDKTHREEWPILERRVFHEMGHALRYLLSGEPDSPAISPTMKGGYYDHRFGFKNKKYEAG